VTTNLLIPIFRLPLQVRWSRWATYGHWLLHVVLLNNLQDRIDRGNQFPVFPRIETLHLLPADPVRAFLAHELAEEKVGIQITLPVLRHIQPHKHSIHQFHGRDRDCRSFKIWNQLIDHLRQRCRWVIVGFDHQSTHPCLFG